MNEDYDETTYDEYIMMNMIKYYIMKRYILSYP